MYALRPVGVGDLDAYVYYISRAGRSKADDYIDD
jgi:hypothetical protein